MTGVNGADYTFDGLGRLESVTPDGQAAIDYAYDSLDRVADREGDAFTYTGGAIDASAAGTETFGRSPSGNVISIVDGGSSTVVVRDRHGDVVATINTSNGSVASTSMFDPFGEPFHTTGTGPSVGFQGDYTDPTTGDVWMGRVGMTRRPRRSVAATPSSANFTRRSR